MNDLVKGYLTATRRDAAMNARVDHVAVFNDGTIKISRDKLLSADSFNRKGWKWEPINAVPDGAEFCGNYPANM